MTAEIGPAGETDGLVERLWQDLLEKDDRTSPAEYPNMALITHDEFAAALSQLHERVAELERDDTRNNEAAKLIRKAAKLIASPDYIDKLATVERERDDAVKSIADMAERFRAVNVSEAIKQTIGENVFALRERAEAAEAKYQEQCKYTATVAMEPISDILCDPSEELQDYIECDLKRMEWKRKAEEAEAKVLALRALLQDIREGFTDDEVLGPDIWQRLIALSKGV